MRMLRSVMLALAAVGFLMVLPVPMDASPGYLRTITYYVGCAGSETAVGGATRDCEGHWSYWGQQSGEWKEVDDESCGNGENFTDYYVFCNGQWIQVSYVDCPCS
jgi:hypothetical protein